MGKSQVYEVLITRQRFDTFQQVQTSSWPNALPSREVLILSGVVEYPCQVEEQVRLKRRQLLDQPGIESPENKCVNSRVYLFVWMGRDDFLESHFSR